MKNPAAVSFKLVVSIGKNAREYTLGHEAIRTLLWSSGEVHADEFFWDALAAHPSAEIRAEVAGASEFIGNLRSLLDDASVDVRAAVLENGPSKRLSRIAPVDLIKLISTDDIKVVKAIAANLAWFDGEDELDAALDILYKHPDPSVRLFVARDERAGSKRLKALGKDADPQVAKAAQDHLSSESLAF